MDRSDDTLFAELRELRPTPRPEFTAKLDERAAAGFPRGGSTSVAATPFARLADWWLAKTPTARLAPVLAVALAALLVAAGVIALAHSGSATSTDGRELGAVTSSTSSESGEAAGGTEAAPNQKSLAAPSTESATPPAVAAEATEEAESSGGAADSARAAGHESSVEGTVNQPTVPGAATPRHIERSAYVVLGTRPGEVSAAAARVYEAVHAADGVVLHSSVQSGKAGATGASFDLLIPSRKLDSALATFSQIAEVRERHDATNDITAPTVGAAEELADSNARVESLLGELGDAETEEERESVEARLHEERRRHASIRAALDGLHERSSMSEVSVRIVTGNGAGVAPAGKADDGDWGVGDALGDAGDILTVAAGVALICLAVLGPLALIAILLWGGNHLRVRRLRERTLG